MHHLAQRHSPKHDDDGGNQQQSRLQVAGTESTIGCRGDEKRQQGEHGGIKRHLYVIEKPLEKRPLFDSQ